MLDYDWVLDLDIKSFFDDIDWELLMRAVRRHTDCKWVLLYLERWLRAPVCMPDGQLIHREKGTPQGAVVSPVLANLFLHYAFDLWMRRNIRTCSSNVTQMMLSAIVEAKHKRKSCVWRLKSGWRNAGCDCIRTRPRSSTAKTQTERELSRSGRSISRLHIQAEISDQPSR